MRSRSFSHSHAHLRRIVPSGSYGIKDVCTAPEHYIMRYIYYRIPYRVPLRHCLQWLLRRDVGWLTRWFDLIFILPSQVLIRVWLDSWHFSVFLLSLNKIPSTRILLRPSIDRATDQPQKSRKAVIADEVTEALPTKYPNISYFNRGHLVYFPFFLVFSWLFRCKSRGIVQQSRCLEAADARKDSSALRTMDASRTALPVKYHYIKIEKV